jgi:twitching motility protein PilT
MINQREVGVDVPSFQEALRRSLRMDPDVILVGELRDLETIEAALRAAETGHLVFGTLHTTSAQGTITRIVDQFPVNQQEQIRVQLSTSLIAVLCQALMPRADARGMVAGFEFMVVTNAIANLIRENKVYRIPSSLQTGRKLGMQLLDDHLFQLFCQKKISLEDAIDHSHHPGELQDKIEQFQKGMIVMPTDDNGMIDPNNTGDPILRK